MPGCGLARKAHTWGLPNKNCEGPEKKPKHNFAFDMDLLKSLLGNIKKASNVPASEVSLDGDDLDLDIPNDDGFIKANDCDNASVANLTAMLKQLEFEEEAVLKKKKLDKLKSQVEAKKNPLNC